MQASQSEICDRKSSLFVIWAKIFVPFVIGYLRWASRSLEVPMRKANKIQPGWLIILKQTIKISWTNIYIKINDGNGYILTRVKINKISESLHDTKSVCMHVLWIMSFVCSLIILNSAEEFLCHNKLEIWQEALPALKRIKLM